MDIHQLSVQYLRDQDRILMRFNTTTQEELRLWLTRALLRGWWPHLRAGSALLLTAPGAGTSAGAGQAPAGLAPALPEQRENADLATPFQDQGSHLPLGSEPLLITEVSQMQKGQRMAISFHEKREDRDEERGFELELEPELLQGLVQLLELSLRQTDWGLLPGSPSAPPAGEDPGSTGPRYLH